MTREAHPTDDGRRDPSLDSALRDLARDDARRARDASARVMTGVLTEFRARHATGFRGLSPASRRWRVARVSGRRWIPSWGAAFGLALAATLVAALAAPLWMVSRGAVGGTRVAMPGFSTGAGESEVTTAFLPLPYGAVPTRDAQIVRIEVPRAALGVFGLLPAEDEGPRTEDVVLADVIVGEDGLARAVRFVRAPIARAE